MCLRVKMKTSISFVMQCFPKPDVSVIIHYVSSKVFYLLERYSLMLELTFFCLNVYSIHKEEDAGLLLNLLI